MARALHNTTRRSLRLILLLCLGAATSVVLALALAMAPDASSSSGSWGSRSANGRTAVGEWSDKFGRSSASIMFLVEDKGRPTGLRALPGWAPSGPFDATQEMNVDVFAYGWPMRCMRCFRWHPSGGWVLRPSVSGERRVTLGQWTLFLPTDPYWAGLFVNTVIFAISWMILPRPIRAVHRLWRREHALCEQCAYNLRGNRSGRCPECGHQITWMLARAPKSSPSPRDDEVAR